MSNPFYTVVEVQQTADGAEAALTQCFDEESAAESNYFTRCSAAAISAIPYHAVYLINSQFGAVKEEKWIRDLNPPES